MHDLDSLPEELSYLKIIGINRFKEYKKSEWLISDFTSGEWTFSFGAHQFFSINFHVQIDDGSYLTDERNSHLLELFKCWILIQTHFDVTSLISLSPKSAYQITRKIVTLIDFFLINAKYFKLSKFGLMNITENDVINLLAQLCSSSDATTSVYQWPIEFAKYIRSELKNTDKNDLEILIAENPFLSEDIPDKEDWLLDLTENEIVLARAALWKSGLYKTYYRSIDAIESYRYCPDSKKITKIIYANTLSGVNQKPHPPELLLQPVSLYRKEYARASVREKGEDVLHEREWWRYRKMIRSMGLLHQVGIHVPIHALKATNFKRSDEFILKNPGRYRTLAPRIVLDSLRKSLEFALSYGPDILESALNVIKTARNRNTNCVTLSATDEFKTLLTPKVLELGVKVWSLKSHIINYESQMPYVPTISGHASDYFKRMRNNEGLFELLRILIGAVQFSTGALSARRQGELLDLMAGKALDKSKSNIIFENRKSGIAGMRVKEARPIPSVIAKLIEMLENFQKQLIEIGAYPTYTNLFSHPEMLSGKPTVLLAACYNFNLEYLCDYIQTPLNESNERYYFRQHQLRRFFAMMFFWGGSFGGMDALRWFLGHTDIEHLYHYITESTPGNVLRASKAHYGIEMLKSNPEAVPELAKIVHEKFNTWEFKILDSEELQEYIEDLQIQNQISIEPVFLDGPKGKEYLIAVKVLNNQELLPNG